MNSHPARPRQHLRQAVTVLILTATLAACGQMGPLYQPPPAPSQDSQPSGGAAG